MSATHPHYLDSASHWFGRRFADLDHSTRRALSHAAERRAIATAPATQQDVASFGERMADRVARFGGSWAFIGLFALFQPQSTVWVLIMAFGLLALADGVVSLLSVFRKDVALPNWLLLLYAAASIGFGLLAIFQAQMVATVLVWLLAIWLVVAGIARIVFAVQMRRLVEGNWLLALSGILALLLGLLFIARPNAPTKPDADHSAPSTPATSAMPADGELTRFSIGSRNTSTAAPGLTSSMICKIESAVRSPCPSTPSSDITTTSAGNSDNTA